MEIRSARLEDAQLLFEWRSDPDTRAMSRDADELVYDRHLAWVRNRLARPNPGLYIAQHQGENVGTLRIDGDEISYTIAPKHRQKGHGEAMLIKAREMFGQKIAKIKRGNLGSAKVAERAGHIVQFID